MCAILVNRQIGYMLHTDFGFKTDAILTIRIFPREKKPDVLADEIRHIPGVAKVIEESTAPLGWAHFGFPAKFKGRQELNMMVSADYSNEEFIPFYQMRLLAGRNIMHSDSLREIVVNETLAKSIGAATPADAIGKILYQEDRLAKTEKALPIVGVVADFHEQSFHQPIGPVIIGHLPDVEKFLGVKLASTGKDASDVHRILKQIEARWKENYPERDIDLAFFDESVRSFYDKEVQTADMMKLIVAVSIFISCIGLYGLSMFAASQRRKEMGIRKVLGATIADLLVLLNREFVYLILLALLIASPLAVYCMHWWLQDFVYRVSIGWQIFAMAGLGALMIALITVSFQAIRAATANPVTSLKEE
jgi:ABC-type lipoprotein release transport system permease subunit